MAFVDYQNIDNATRYLYPRTRSAALPRRGPFCCLRNTNTHGTNQRALDNMNGYRFEHLPQHPGLRTLLTMR
jgi:hypothetical protein